jgi:hypothetical protein
MNMKSACIKITCLLVFIFLYSPHAFSQGLAINEVMSSNSTTISDEDGSFSDWIEIVNQGDVPINISGYGLSDDYTEPFKWVFPDYELAPGEYLLVWASGKDRKPVIEETNGIIRRFYSGISGQSVDDVIYHESFPNNPSQTSIVRDAFDAPVDVADYYGQHMFAWISPPVTGDYTFWIASDDNSKLYLSSDESTGNLSLIAEVPGHTSLYEWDKYPEQGSQKIYLQAENRYYISALMKEGGGGDHLTVRWELPNETIEEPLNAQNCFVPAGEFHTNFSINSDGEEILITSPDGIMVDEMPEKTVPTDISYGRVPDGTGDFYFFETPTPGAGNNTSYYSGISAKPEITPDGGFFKEPVSFTIEAVEGASIYYTLDGSQPDEYTNLYSSPIEISATAKISVIAIEPGKMKSAVTSSNFSVVNNDLEDFDSNLPLMVIHEYDTPISPDDRTEAYMVINNSETEARNSLTDAPEFHGKVVINKRGSSSLGFPKNNYGFHILEEDGSNRKVSLLGLPEEHNWVLHGPYSDKTLMRNALAFGLSNDIGQYSPRTRFIELFIHSGAGNLDESSYHGVYLLTQRIKTGPGNVNISELENYHNDYPEITGGYIFKIDRLNPREQGFVTDRDHRFVFVRPDESSISFSQKEYLRSYLDSTEQALFGAYYKDPDIGYAAFLDVQSFIDMHLITELAKEIDGYRLSTFFHKDRQGKINAGPLWDFNLAFGNADYLEGWNPEGWYYPLISQTEYVYGWYNRLFQDETFEKKYTQRYRSLRNGRFSNAYLNEKILSNYNLLSEAQERNFNRWNVLGQYVWPNWFIGDNYDDEVFWMVDWLERRLEWMDSQLGEPYTIIQYWNFNEPSVLLQPTYSTEGGNITIDKGLYAEITDGSGKDFSGINAKNNDKAETHLRINNPIGTEVIFDVPSTGYQDLLFSYETRRSGSGANRQIISYTVNGTDFVTMDTIVVTETPVLQQYGLTHIAETEDNSQLAIKISIYQELDGTGGVEGNNRFDNVTLEGEPKQGTIVPPVYEADLPDPLKLIENDSYHSVSLSNYFSHPGGESLSYQVNVENDAVLNTELDGGILKIYPGKRGGTSVMISVDDGVNPPLESKSYVTVYPEAIDVSDQNFKFNFWSPDQPQGAFPDHMIFMQSQQDDPSLSTDMCYAYHIPADDYDKDDEANIGFPYRNQSRTRINGLNENGISFINTGRGRDVGAAVLALSTLNMDELYLNWEASTLSANSRVYYIRLQYRTDIEDAWIYWRNESNEVIEYERSTSVLLTEKFENIPFHEEILDEEYVQIRWVYYYTGERLDSESGARDMLALHAIMVLSDFHTDTVDVDDEKLRIFPNPVLNGYLFLNKRVTGKIYNLEGAQTHQLTDDNSINVQNLPRGIYFLAADGGEVLKFIIQ